MTDPVHPRSLWGTGAPFQMDGKVRNHPSAPVPPLGHRVLRTVEAVSPGELVCCHRYSTEPQPPELDQTRHTYTVVQCVEMDWGQRFGEPCIAYDLILAENDDVPCPLCLIKEVMES